MRAMINSEIPTLREARDNLPEGLYALIERSLQLQSLVIWMGDLVASNS